MKKKENQARFISFAWLYGESAKIRSEKEENCFWIVLKSLS